MTDDDAVTVCSCKGYAGRTELPDNLKALFRPVTMIVPDLLQVTIARHTDGDDLARHSSTYLLNKHRVHSYWVTSPHCAVEGSMLTLCRLICCALDSMNADL